MSEYSIAVTLIVIGFLVVAGSLESSTMTNMAIVEAVTLGIYWDSDCTKEVDSIFWGTLFAGSSKTVNLHVMNQGNATVCLSLDTANWEPSEASEFIDLGWDYAGETISTNNVAEAALTLSVSRDTKVTGTFSFNIIISPIPPRPVDRTRPEISIMSPEAGAAINGSSLLLRWAGRDSGSGIDYFSVYLNSKLAQLNWKTSCELLGLIEGLNNIRVVAHDKAGNIREDRITVNVDNTPPRVSMSCLEGEKVRRTATLDFSASDDNLAKLFIQIDGDVFDVTGMQCYEWDTSSAYDGTHTIKVIATDKAGNTNSSSLSIFVDNTEAVLTLLSPADGAVVTGLLNVQFYVFDISSVNVVSALDEEDHIDITGRNSFNVDTAQFGDGIHTISFIVTDALGNSVESTTRIIVDKTSPSVGFNAPTNGCYVRDTITIMLEGNDTNFDRMELCVSGEVAERWHSSGLRRYDWNTENCEDGTQVLKAVVYDKAGNIAEKSLTLNIDNTVPNVSIISPSKRGVTGTCNLRFSASDANIAKVLLHVGKDMFDVAGTASYAWNTLGVKDGEHIVKISAKDKAGNFAEMQIMMTTTNQYLIAESIRGIILITIIYIIWPLASTYKHSFMAYLRSVCASVHVPDFLRKVRIAS